MKLALEQLQLEGGQSPGPNGLRYDDLDHYLVWDMIRALSDSIRAGTYQPGPTRSVKIPKSSGGTRTLTLANIEDRVVSKAALMVIQPMLDPTFDACSFGGRPGRDRLNALAEAKYQTETQGRRIWVIEDIQSAFDKVPFGRLRDVLRKRLPNKDVCELVERLARRRMNGRVTKLGIQQGNPLSPLLLNLYLDHILDRVWKRKFPDLPLLRTIDDILVPVSGEEDVQRVRNGLRELLVPGGMPLQKTKSQVVHLEDSERTVWLGYELSWHGGVLDVQIPQSGWEVLEKSFIEAHESPFPSRKAEECLVGWLSQQGPAYSHHKEIIPRLHKLASCYAHEELPAQEELAGIWERAYGRWNNVYGKLLLKGSQYVVS
ncbi:MAG: reverse transcriptase domain-containing protein [Pirellulales bacterium]